MLLRAVAVFVLLLAVCCAWVFWRYSVERRAMTRLQDLGVRYATTALGPKWLTDWAQRHDLPVLQGVAWGKLSIWVWTDHELEQLAGLTRLENLNVYGNQVTEAGLAHLEALPGLRTLELRGAVPEPDAWLPHLEGLAELRSLVITNARMTDTTFKYLTTLRRLEDLALRDSEITDAGLAHLPRLSNLRTLEFRDTIVPDAELEQMTSLHKLSSLTLWGTPTTDAGVAHLAELASLESLDLAGTQITDAGLAHLTRLAKLKELSLSDTGITDAGLVHLMCIPKLASVRVRGTQISRQGVEVLMKFRPLLQVHHDYFFPLTRNLVDRVFSGPRRGAASAAPAGRRAETGSHVP